jgi:hypothetical protein
VQYDIIKGFLFKALSKVHWAKRAPSATRVCSRKFADEASAGENYINRLDWRNEVCAVRVI